ncbi:MAG: serine/threonine-protein kinase, partial [Planctomycetota bacterium]|nr:serine/threonine-protein kinase [Planctomycetota bacterium]
MGNDGIDNSAAPSEQEKINARRLRDGLRELFQTQPMMAPHAELIYETLEKIGEGGMGTVYRVRDHRLNRDAAIKIVNQDRSDPEFYERFLRETKITAKLNHPSIPPVYEVGMTPEGQPFLLMRLIEGETLTKRAERLHKRGCKIAELREMIEMVIKAGEAVSYAHSQGVIHRDLKPDNIMVGNHGEVMVMDWGIARDSEDPELSERCLRPILSAEEIENSGLTVSGTLLGTPGYMSPEQAFGEDVDERTDVFALGAILIKVVSGEAAISGDSMKQILFATISGNIELPKTSLLNSDFLKILEGALDIDVERRIPSIEELNVQLRAFLAGEEIPGLYYGPVKKTARIVAKRPGLFLGTALLLMAMLGVAVLLLELDRAKALSDRAELSKKLLVEKAARAQELAERNALKARLERDVAQKKIRDSEKADALFAEARDRHRRGLKDQFVIESIQSALTYSGRGKGALLQAAQIMDDAGIVEPAKALLLEVSKNYPPAYSALFRLHLQVLRLNNTDFFKGTEYLAELIRRAEALGDENEFTLFNRAITYHNAGDLKRALEYYGKVERYSTKLGVVYSNRASARFDVGDVKGSLADCKKALKINPEDAIAHYNLGKVYDALTQYEKAIDCFTVALKLNPKDYMSYANRGASKAKQGKWSDALIDVDEALKIHPNSHLCLGSRGGIRWKLGDKRGALEDYNQSIAIDPKNAQILMNRGRVFMDAGRGAAAIDDFSQAIELDKNSVAK